MKYLRLIFILMLYVMILCPLVSAENPVDWVFSLETFGGRDDWYSSPAFIDPGYGTYYYDWVITSTSVQVEGGWYSDPCDYSGSGSTGPLPISGLPPVYHIDEPEITANIYVDVDLSGYVDLYIDDVIFGEAMGYPVTGMRFEGNLNIIPEPATLLVLVAGGAMLRLRRRKYRA